MSAAGQQIGLRGTGTFIQTGGTNTVDDSLLLGFGPGGQGSYELGLGRLSTRRIYVGLSGTGTFTQTGGTNNVSDDLRLGDQAGARGTYSIFGGTLTAYALDVGGQGGGTLEIADPAAEIFVARLGFAPQSSLAAVSGAKIHLMEMDASFQNRSIDPAALAGLNNLTLVFDETFPTFPHPLEAGGRDLGRTMDGFSFNFALDTLQIGGDRIGQVQLGDYFDNQPAWTADEALYVKNLILGLDSYLDLNGLNLYYLNFTDLGGTYELNGGYLVQVPEPATLSPITTALTPSSPHPVTPSPPHV